MISSQFVWTLTCNVSQEHCFRLQNSENKTLHSYQTLLPIYQTARWHNPEYYDINLHLLGPLTDRVQGQEWSSQSVITNQKFRQITEFRSIAKCYKVNYYDQYVPYIIIVLSEAPICKDFGHPQSKGSKSTRGIMPAYSDT